jgi:hypothetical protein
MNKDDIKLMDFFEDKATKEGNAIEIVLLDHLIRTKDGLKEALDNNSLTDGEFRLLVRRVYDDINALLKALLASIIGDAT